MHLWIDDDRAEPEGWLRVSNCVNAIRIISSYGPRLKAISFDYDIGVSGNGADVAQYLSDSWELHGIPTKLELNIHSGNPMGVQKIKEILEDLYAQWGRTGPVPEKSAAQMWED